MHCDEGCRVAVAGLDFSTGAAGKDGYKRTARTQCSGGAGAGRAGGAGRRLIPVLQRQVRLSSDRVNDSDWIQ